MGTGAGIELSAERRAAAHGMGRPWSDSRTDARRLRCAIESTATAVPTPYGCSARSPSQRLIPAQWLLRWRTSDGCSPADSSSNTSR